MSEEKTILEEKLRQTQIAYQRAAQMSQFKAGFLARTSHELRSPLSSLISLHQLILADLCNSKEEERECIAQAYESARKLMTILDEIIAVSKTDYGSDHLDIRSYQIAEIFTELVHLTHLQAANRNLKLTIVPPSPNREIKVDYKRLLQALVNLVDLAILNAQEGTVSVSANFTETNQIQINIDCQCLPELFSEPINSLQQQQLNSEASHSSRHQFELSTGMKFSLAQTLVEAMGGKINVLEVSSKHDQPLTRLQCLLTLPSAEIEGSAT